MPPTLVRDLLDLPEHVSRGDFVQSLADSLQHPKRTVTTYAVTPALVQNFHDALRLVAGALSTGRSQPVFLHGSFGSGKSHFMALLHLMLQGHRAPWQKPALHPLRDTYTPLADKKLLQLHFHMLGARSFESAVFKGYIDFVQARHPDATLPALFRDQEVFDNAAQLRLTLGDDAFFAALNKGKKTIAGLGTFGRAAAWTPARFDSTVASADAKGRQALFSDLVKNLLSAYTQQSDRFVDTDDGLGELSRHAAGLGYDGVVLYLDELILWLASRSADLPFVQREINKLVKLKEARDEARTVPIVAFIARQRDLSEMLGEAGTGAERALIEETIGHHRSRFHTIELKDSNLRAIIPHRVVIPLPGDPKARLDDGFASMWRDARPALDTLQGGTADQADFRQVYPFSPALIDVLVALSGRLQRDRTAIRILVEMLVEHLPDLKLGEVVPVGDVFDLVASADDAIDGPSRAAFQRARDLYLHEILPLLQQQHDALTPERCQRLRDGHPIRLGCGGCAVALCRADNRLIKTLLLAALVPKAKPFDGLTVKRLVHLNHGAVRAPIEAMRINMAATRLRTLARDVHPIRIGDERDPVVLVSLQSINLNSILTRADDQDTQQRRRALLRRLLFTQLGLSGVGTIEKHTVEYRHTRRTGTVVFGNVRTLRDEALRCPESAEWQVVVDYPFDSDGYTPYDDERRVAQARDGLKASTATLVWLPTFFSQQVLDDLGDLARLEHILTPDLLRGFLSNVPPAEHQRARIDLESLRDRKRFEIIEALKKAYGLTSPRDDDPHLDQNRRAEQHLHSLQDDLDPRTPRSATLGEGLQDLARQILEARYPHHPQFQTIPSPAKLGRVRLALEKLIEHGDATMAADAATRSELERLAVPLKLCRVLTQQVEIVDQVFDNIEQNRLQANVEDPSVEQVTRWIDPRGLRGLQQPSASLIVWLWAVRHKRVARSGHVPVDWPSNARLDPYVVFSKPDLPDERDFTAALNRAVIFDVTQPLRALNARNLSQLARKLRPARGDARSTAAAALPAKLQRRLQELTVQGTSNRLVTANTLATLLAAMNTTSDRALIEALANAQLDGTSVQALARNHRTAPAVGGALDGHAWTVLNLLRERLNDDRVAARAQDLLDQAAALLIDDELNAPLPARLRELADAARKLLEPPAPGDWKRAWSGTERHLPPSAALAALDRLRAELERAIAATGDAPARVNLSLSVETRDPGESR